MFWIGPALPERLLVFAVLRKNKRAVGILIFNALDHIYDGAILILILECCRDDLLGYAPCCAVGRSATVPTVRVRRWLARQRRAGGNEVALIEVFDERDHVAAFNASTTIEDLLLGVDREAVFAATDRTWAAAICLTIKADAALLDHALDGDLARLLYPCVE
jgi:hypothetical protein